MRIGITYNLREELTPLSVLSSEYNEEFDSTKTIDVLSMAFEKNGFDTIKLGGGIDIIDTLKKEKVDFVFNIAEGHYGRNREGWIPSILEMLNIPYSGSDPLTLGLALDKIIAKKLFQNAKIPTPSYGIVRKIEDIEYIENTLQYPLIVKPNWEGSSKGIYNFSQVMDKSGLQRSVRTLLGRYPNQPILVEEYIKGREITVGLIGNDTPQIIGLMEIANKRNPGKDFFYSLEVKRDWKNLVEYISPPDIAKFLDTKIRHYAIIAFKEFGCRDIARLDFRISEYNEPFLLEINPLPGLSPQYGDLVIMSQKNSIEYQELVSSILSHAFSRYGIAKKLEYEKI